MAGSSDIRAGRAFIELTLKNRAQVEQALKNIAGKFSAVGKVAQAMGAAMAGIGAGVLGGLGKLGLDFAETGAGIDDMSKKTGVSAKALQELAYAASQSGTDIDTVSGAITKMQRSLIDAAEGTGAGKEALDALGLSVDELLSMSPDEQFKAIAEGISKVQDPAMKAALAMAIFGKGGAGLLPLLEEGKGGIDALAKAFQQMGGALSDEDVATAARLDDAWDTLKKTVLGTALQIGSAVAPALLAIAEAIQPVIAEINRFIAQNKGLVVGVAAAAAGLIVLGGAIFGLGAAISVAGLALGGIATALGAVSAVVGALLSPIGLAVAGVIALTVAIGAGIVYALKASGVFDGLGKTFSGSWKSIVAAVSSGDLATAFAIAWKTVQVVWAEATLGLRQTFDDLLTYLRDAWRGLVNFIADAMLALPGAEAVFGEGARQALKEDFSRQSQSSETASDSRRDERLAEVEKLKRELADLQKEASGQVGAQIPNRAKIDFVETAKAVSQVIEAKVSDLQRGTFSGDFASRRLGLGAIGPQERTAAATEESAKTLKELLDEMKNNSIEFG